MRPATLADALAAARRAGRFLRERAGGAARHALRRRRGPSRDEALSLRPGLHPGSRRRRYLLHLPPGHDTGRPLPLVMLLHGCGQTHLDIRALTGLDAVADRRGCAVVYPYVTRWSGLRMRDCWGWWEPDEIRAGAGEVEDLWLIVEEIGERIALDRRRVHVAGLSAGAGMAAAVMIAHAERIASGALVGGVPYGEGPLAVRYRGNARPRLRAVPDLVEAMRSALGPDRSPPPVLIAHGDADPVVDVQAALQLRDTWAECLGLDPARPARSGTGRRRGLSWTRHRYGAPGRRAAVETLIVHGGGHGWFGAAEGPFGTAGGPDLSREIIAFFARHPRHHPHPAAAGRLLRLLHPQPR